MTTMQTGRASYSSVACDNNNNVGQGKTPKIMRMSGKMNCNDFQVRYKQLQWKLGKTKSAIDCK